MQIVKHRQGKQLVEIDIVKAYGSWKRIEQGLDDLGYNQPNTSAVERFNATARRMNAHQVRRSLAFAHRTETRRAFAWWSATVYNWVRPHRSLRLELDVPQGTKRFQPRTPAMTIGLTDRIWEVAGLLRYPVYPEQG